MFPKTKLGEKKHRKHKRSLEISLVIETISDLLKDDPYFKSGKFDILEFGSGDGFQISHLQKIGNVISSDIYTSDNIKSMKNVKFIECDITNTPFKNEQFDIISSNHVIEHIKDKPGAFKELIRIGKPNCIYALSVPTNIWLLLAIPAQYYNKTRAAISRFAYIFRHKTINSSQNSSTKKETKIREKNKGIMLFRRILPIGHGVYSNFIDCYRFLKIKKWRQLFSSHCFSIIKTQPLLLYAPSEWPIIPTTKLLNRLNICSSVLFLMKKR